MDISAIEKLIKLVEGSSVTEFCYKEGEMELSISKAVSPAAVPVQAAPAAAPAPVIPAAEDEPIFITSPIVATFYSAAAPDVPAYVKVGDRVRSGDTVCILEAMKLMTELTADFDCEIEAILVSNEQRVEYGQPLFRVKKL